jgi:molybdopterin molybdotransferase
MIPFEEALRMALEGVNVLDARRVPLTQASGLILAEDAASDTDLPPFDRAAMDGYAVRSADLTESGRELVVVGEVTAGEEPALEIAPGQCVRIFTGAVTPEGADAVAMQEITSPGGGEGRVRFAEAVEPGANIAKRGEDVRAGDVVLRAGARLGAARIALAAAAGVAELTVIPRPSVSVLSTGSELVPAGRPVRPGQIRDANGPALVSRIGSAGFAATFLGIAPDDADETTAKIEAGLESDCLVISGGVSVGDRDFVPEVLRDLGVEFRFSRVAVKPGKPTKFGLRGAQVVFGLPGNPVSALVVAELLVLPVLRRMAGREDTTPRARRGRLTRDTRKKKGRRLFAPARLVDAGAGEGTGLPEVEPLEYHGSADLAAYSRTDVLFTLPAESAGEPAGAEVDFYVRED